jgi:N-acetylglutamate synthase-like GNAT family acetyltransferase
VPRDNPMNVSIRPMRSADLDQVLQLLARWNIAPQSPTAETPVPERTNIIIGNTFVAEDAGKIVGVRSFIQLSATEAEGASMAVDPAYQRHGIAKALALAGWRVMWERGIRKIRSETDRSEVVEWLTRDYGYRIIGTAAKRHAFGNSEADHWTVLELDLDETVIRLASEAQGRYPRNR